MSKIDCKTMNNASLIDAMRKLESEHDDVKNKIVSLYARLDEIDMEYNQINLELKKRRILK